MEAGYQLLSAEINRIIGSPYPTQLKQLHNIVCARCSGAAIAKCFRIGACKVDALVLCLLEGLQQWPYVLDIIIRLSREVIVRDSILVHEPGFLQDVLVQACKTDNVQSKYAAAAVSMLSHPLPIDIAVPASVQTLFLRLVEHAARNPSSHSIEPVHRLLTGLSTSLLGLLSDKALAQFQEQIFSILRNSTVRGGQHHEDHSLVLYCLAVMHQIASASEEQLLLTNSFGITQELLASTQPTSSRWDAGAMREYFDASAKAPKTIQLVVLRVIEACHHNSNPSTAMSSETLALANEIIGAFRAKVKSAWCAANPLILERLQQKAINAQTEHGAHLHALCFVHQLCKDTAIAERRDTLLNILTHPKRLIEASYSIHDSIWARCLSGALDKSVTEALLRNISGYIVDASPSELIEGFEILKSLLQTLQVEINEDDTGVAGASFVPNDLRLQNSLNALREDAPLPEDVSQARRGSVCEGQYLSSRRGLIHALSGVLLRGGLVGGQGTSENMSELLLHLYAGSTHSRTTCYHARPQRATKISFVEQESTPPDAAFGWRQALQRNLQAQAQTSHDTLSSLFAQACFELETRCEGVEIPLRQEQDRRAALQEECDQMNSAYAELEAQHVDRKLQLSAMQDEKDHCLHELDGARQEVDQALERIERLQKVLETSQAEAEDEITDLQRAREAADLEHATALAQKEAQLEELQETLGLTDSSLRQRVAELVLTRQETQRSKTANTDLNAEVQRLQGEVHGLDAVKVDLQHDMERFRVEIRDKAATIDKMGTALGEAETHSNDLLHEIHTLRDEQEKTRQAHESHLQQVKTHGKQNLEDANASHNKTMDKLAAKHGEEIAGMERALLDARDELQQLSEQHMADLASQKDREEELQIKITDLKRECKMKDRQISEANAMRGNLMAAMGLGGIPVPASLPHRTRSSVPLTQADYSQLEVSQPNALHIEDEPVVAFDGRTSFASNASSGESRNGPTPKRARPRKSFKAASPAKARVSTGAKTGRASLLGRSTMKRQPLLTLNANQSPSKMTPKTPGKVVRMENADEFDDSTFDEHDMMEGRH